MRRVHIVKKNPSNKNKHKKTGFNLFGRFLSRIVLLVLLLLIVCGLYVNSQIENIERTILDVNSLGVTNQAVKMNRPDIITTVALFGIDAGGGGTAHRSDTIMLITVNKESGKIAITSLMRDTFIYIPDHKFAKLNAAYAYGGAELALKTINENFDLSVYDFVTVDFECLSAVVDAIGGIEINVSGEEAYYVNQDLEQAVKKGASNYVTEGINILSGKQTLSYARIRHLGNSDFDRTARQRLIVTAILNKIKSIRNPATFCKLVKTVCEYTVTSLSSKQIYGLMYSVLAHNGLNDIKTFSLTKADYLKSATVNGESVLVPYALTDLAGELHGILYPEYDYSPTELLIEKSDSLRYQLRNVHVETIYTGTTF